MKGKMLIVIMVIFILLFSIQAATALEEDNNLTLTHTSDTDIQTVDNTKDLVDSVNSNTTVVPEIVSDSSNNHNLSLNKAGSNDILGATDYYVNNEGITTLEELRIFISNLTGPSNIFLQGKTFTGDITEAIVVKSEIHFYGGNSITDPTRATFDLSQFKAGDNFINVTHTDGSISGVNFINANRTGDLSSFKGKSLMLIGSPEGGVKNYVVSNCTFKNNFLDISPGRETNFLKFHVAGDGGAVNNCEFYNNRLAYSVHVYAVGNNKRFTANNNKFINNTANPSPDSGANGNGLCFKIWNGIRNAYFINNTFINNTNAIHGAAYCLFARDVYIINNYLEGNHAIYAGGIEAHNGYINVYNSTFINNLASGGSPQVKGGDRNASGGAIGFLGGNNIVDNCTFINNTADRFAGAISIIGANTIIRNSSFINNIAQQLYGGAIDIQGLQTRIENCSFENNSAPMGGAIRLQGDNVRILNSNFTHNIAIQGGACFIEGFNSYTFNSIFIDNMASHKLPSRVFDNTSLITSGGGIYIKGDVTNIVDSHFRYNSAKGIHPDDGFGGAVFIDGKNIIFTKDIFENNDAIHGGGVFVDGDNITVQGLNLIHNEAIQGGSVYIKGNGITINQTNSENNLAIQGGAFYIEGDNTVVINSQFNGNNATRNVDVNTNGTSALNVMGGAIAIEGSYVDINFNNFTYNTAQGTIITDGLGGAISIEGHNVAIDTNIVHNNQAVSGGAIYINGPHALITNINFITNYAIRGGGVFINGLNTNIRNVLFMHNNATHDLSFNISDEIKALTCMGGAVTINGNNSVLENVNFTNNTAIGIHVSGGLGGAIAVNGFNSTIANVDFTFNEAIRGGAIYINGTLNLINQSAFMFNNAVRGGALYILQLNTTIEGVEFKNNSATHNLRFHLVPEVYNLIAAGGAVAIRGDVVNVINSEFYNNTAVGAHKDGGLGGAIAVNGSNNYIYNSKFQDNQGVHGGSFYLEGDNILITKSNFTNNYAVQGGVGYIVGDNSNITESIFHDNAATHYLRFTLIEQIPTAGGVLYILGSNVDVESSKFTNNYADYGDHLTMGGGAFYIDGIDALIKDSSFDNNTAVKGGAVFILGNATKVYDSNFTNNNAVNDTRLDGDGGAVYLEKSYDSDFTRCIFINNTASINGGAINWYQDASNGHVTDCIFINNTADANGGAVFWYGFDGSIKGSNFTNNIAKGTAAGRLGFNGTGGAIFWFGSSGTLDTCNLFNNTAMAYGGGVYFGGLAAESIIKNSNFTNNFAKYNGGAIDCNASKLFLDNSIFDANYAQYGAALCREVNAVGGHGANNLFINNHAFISGAALGWLGAENITITHYIFINNTAEDTGGAIYVHPNSDNCAVVDSYFENSVAGTNGGAIYWDEDAHNGRIINSTFVNNTAHRAGGAVFWNGENGTVIGSNFTNNRATGKNSTTSAGVEYGGDGGAIVWLGPIGLVDNSIFINNSAPKRGGAVYLEASQLGTSENTTFSNCQFINNTAGINGGAIDWHEGAVNGKIENSSFVNNTAGANGGAVLWRGVDGIIINSNFTNNKAIGNTTGFYGNSGDGGAVMWTGSNGFVGNCTFENNYAADNGGAVHINNITAGGSAHIDFVNSKFVNNTAVTNGGGVYWHEDSSYGEVINSTFDNNTAGVDGGAIYWSGHYGSVEGSNFTNNTAKYGGAIYWAGAYGNITGSRFTKNNASNGGAVFLTKCIHESNIKITIDDSYFEENSASRDGGAINWNDGSNVNVTSSQFANNTANRGGALFINGTDGLIKTSNFTTNEAIHGGAVYLNNEGLTLTESDFTENAAIQGGAVYVGAEKDIIANSSFRNNNATYNLRVNTTNNKNKTKGGAIFVAGENTLVDNSEFVNNTAATNRTYNEKGNDGSKSDDGFGGAIYVGSNNVNITSSDFNDNKACNGSALYNNASNLLLKDDSFVKNQAWSYTLKANTTVNSTYYGSTVTVIISNYTGGDNIINGIYNAKSVTDIKFNNVNYIINDTESNVGITTDEYPVNGAKNSNDGARLYQDSLERYQVITVEVINNETGQIVLIKTIKTDYYGNNTIKITDRLAPGNYTIKSYHAEDRNYKGIVTLSNFKVLPYVDVNITKTVNTNITVLGGNITFTIVVSNAANGTNATNLTIKDIISNTFGYISHNVTAGSFNKTALVWNIPVLANGTSAILTLTFNASKIGMYNNTVNVTCNEDEWNYTNNNASVFFEVVPINLTITKIANVTGNITVWDEVTFIINVTNNARGNATDIVVTDLIPNTFKFVSTNATGYNSTTGILNIARLNSNQSYVFTLTLKAMTNGTLVNVVNVTCKQNSTVVKANASVNVNPLVNLTVVKIVDSDDVTIGDAITFTIIITNNGPSNATDIKVTDIPVADSNFVLIIGDLYRTIPFLESGKSTNFTLIFVAHKGGNYTNTVNVTCKENNTIKHANSTVFVYDPDLKINKSANVTGIEFEGLVNFTITVFNHGVSNATGVNITDVLGDYFEFVSANGTYTYDATSKTIVWNIGRLANETRVTVWLTVKALTNGTFNNTAFTLCNEEHTKKYGTAQVVVYPPINYNMTVVKTADDEWVYSGNQTSFTITVTNNGDGNLTGIFVDENIPNGLIYDHFIGSNWTNIGNKFYYNGSLDVGKSVKLIIFVNTTVSGIFTNAITADSNEIQNISANATLRVYTPSLKVREISNNPTAVAGQMVSFTVVVTNTGDCNLSDIDVFNVFPYGLIYSHFTGKQPVEKPSDLLGRTINYVLSANDGWVKVGKRFMYTGILKPGESIDYTIYFKTTKAGVFTPEVIAGSSLTSNSTKDAYSKNTTVVLAPEIEVSKVSNKNTAKVGDLITFTITVINKGKCDVGDISVLEKIPSGLKYVKFTGKGWTKVGNKFKFSNSLAPGDVAILKIIFKATKAGNITNVVVVTTNVTGKMSAESNSIKVVNKTTPTPSPDPKPTIDKHEKVNKPATMKETGNPIVMLILVILTIVPIFRRKH